MGWNGGNDYKAEAGDGRVRREGERNIAIDAVVAEIERDVFGVINLDEFKIAKVRACRGMIHHFADDKRGAFAGGPERVGTGLENGRKRNSENDNEQAARGHGLMRAVDAPNYSKLAMYQGRNMLNHRRDVSAVCKKIGAAELRLQSKK